MRLALGEGLDQEFGEVAAEHLLESRARRHGLLVRVGLGLRRLRR
jgi:hypothetical protein